ncbi:putative leucine-rich repeat-containing protein DDB_G0290503 [Pempheris klunzingeri]|uniref:putative leucine-rich repeat-containing protein DDB_G0290503 n=1 Tax=Pempheris klunzingeri TaxID=3127111 RepID=UPI00397F741E
MTQPQELLNVQELEISSRNDQEQTAEKNSLQESLQSKDGVLQLDSKQVRDRMNQLTKQVQSHKEVINTLHRQLRQLNSQLEDMILEVNCLWSGKTKLQQSLQSEVSNLQSELQGARDKERYLTQQLLTHQEEFNNLHGQWEELNSQLEISRLQVTNLNDGKTRLEDSGSEHAEINEELARVSVLLSKEENVRNKYDTYIRKLEEERLVLSEENVSMAAELARIESLREKLRADNQSLSAAVHDLQENEKILNDNLIAEQEQCKSLRDKNDSVVEHLKADLQSLQNYITIMNEQMKIHISEVTELESLTNEKQAEIEQLRAVVYDFENQAVAQHNHSAEGELLWKVAHLEQLKEKMLTENENLSATVHELEESQNILREQNKIISTEMSLLESETEEKQAQIENLWETVHDLQEHEKIINAQNKDLTDEVAHLETLRKNKLRLTESLRATVHTLQCQIKEANDIHREKEELIQRLTDIESQAVKNHAENERLKMALHNLEEQQVFLNEQNERAVAELARYESATEKHYEEKKNLKAAVQYLQDQLEETNQLMRDNDELILKQKKQIASKQEEIEKLCSLITSLKQSNRDLKDQLEMKNEEEILAGINFKEECRILTEITELDSPEDQRDESPLQTTATDQQQLNILTAEHQELESLRTTVHTLQCQVKEACDIHREKDETIQRLTDVESQAEKRQAENERLKMALRNLEEKEDFLNEQNERVVAELVQYESATAKYCEEKKNLKAAVQNLQDQLEETNQLMRDNNELILKQKKQIAYKQEETEELRSLITNLKQSNLDLKDQLETKNEEEILAGINFKEECRILTEITELDSPEDQRDESPLQTTATDQQQLNILTAEHQELESLRATVHTLQCQVKEACDIHREKDETIQRLTDVESQAEKRQAENERLKMALRNLEEKEDFLNEQNERVVAELVQYESATAKYCEEKKNLKAAVQNLQDQLEETNQLMRDNNELILKQKKQIAYKQEETEELRSLITNLKQSNLDLKDQLETKNEEEILAGINFKEECRILTEITELDSPEDQRDESPLQTTATDQQQLNILTAEHQELESLRATVHTLQCQVKEACDIHREKDETIQRLTDVESQAEKKQVENERLKMALRYLEEKEDFLNEHNERVVAELARHESATAKYCEEKKNLKAAVQNLQDQLEETNQLMRDNNELILKQKKQIAYKKEETEELRRLITNLKQSNHDLKDQLETKHEEEILAGINFKEECRILTENTELDSPEDQRDESPLQTTATDQQLETPVAELESPAAEVPAQTTSMWRRCSKGLLKVCLHAGIFTLGALIPVGVMAATLAAQSNTNLNCMDCVNQVMAPFCNYGHIAPLPF